ncbi:uncharacterized protein C8Q71DRAFT_876807 [Rhodofomes roseus]|uniref:VHS domain-containing protein n=1 Tax=Rhodofomes roseus TaxID=34475 RepID=A0ABQ8KVV8_9APHY|nr:uncharacterized protein C8Q71DRAFT_876807 [Rhodofomes roseus]KAH9842664.1 hypothetical protein C8Q71DRAFT_876807 [Rhodofomes roseus]
MLTYPRIWPALKASKSPAIAYVDFIEQVRNRRDRLPPAECGVSADSIITEAVRQAIQRTSFTQYAPPSIYSYYASSSANNRTRTLELLRLCLTTGNKPLCSLVFKRLLDSTFHREDYIDNVLVPFLPELRQFLTTNHVAPSEEPFNSAFKSIVMLWANKVLGPRPSETANTIISRMQNHGCKCLHCVQVFKFLTANADKTCRLERIGAPKRKHVEQELGRYAQTAATWTMISGSPQGLTITKADSIYLPVKWKATHARGTTILNSISLSATELQRIFGVDHQIITDMMAGRVSTSLASASRLASSSMNPPVPAGPARAPTGGPTVQAVAGTVNAMPTSNPSGSSSNAPLVPSATTSASSQTTRKRKREYTSSDIIDLTDDWGLTNAGLLISRIPRS